MQIICRNCEGRGRGDGEYMFFVCPRCEGSGYEQAAQHKTRLTNGGLCAECGFPLWAHGGIGHAFNSPAVSG